MLTIIFISGSKKEERMSFIKKLRRSSLTFRESLRRRLSTQSIEDMKVLSINKKWEFRAQWWVQTPRTAWSVAILNFSHFQILSIFYIYKFRNSLTKVHSFLKQCPFLQTSAEGPCFHKMKRHCSKIKGFYLFLQYHNLFSFILPKRYHRI